MIREAIVSSADAARQVNFAPLGVHIRSSGPGDRVSLRLYAGSQTYANLRASGQGVICFCDDVLLFVETALFSACPPHVPSQAVIPPRLAAAATAWEFIVTDFDAVPEPAVVAVKIVYRLEGGYAFPGFCRAELAVLEATIAATRLRWAADKLTGRWDDWREAVVKTGGSRERQAFNRVGAYLAAKGLAFPPVPDVQR